MQPFMASGAWTVDLLQIMYMQQPCTKLLLRASSSRHGPKSSHAAWDNNVPDPAN